MKLIKFHIQNFQSHKDTVVEFTDGLNIIVGATETGKSSILRALRKLIRDEPSGKVFISRWASNMELALDFLQGGIQYTVRRRLTPSKNLYHLDTQDFGGFGKLIPQEIQDVLNMKLIELETGDTIDLHFLGQHDTPFMISKGSAGVRSKLLGKIAGLHVLDSAISQINSDIRAVNSDLKRVNVEKDKLYYELEDFPDLWYDQELVTQLFKRIEQVKGQETLKEQISALYGEYLIIIQEITSIQSIINQLPKVKANFTQIKAKHLKLAKLSAVVHELAQCSDKLKKLKTLIPPEIIEDFKGIKERIESLNALQSTYKKLVTIVEHATAIRVTDIDKDLKKYVKEHETLLNTLGICPTCKRPVKLQ